MPAPSLSVEPVPTLIVAKWPAAAVTVAPVATVRFVVPGETATAAGSAGRGTSAETFPCVAPVPETRWLV